MQPPYPSGTIGATQVVVDAIQVVPFQIIGATQLPVADASQVLVAAFHTMGATQLPIVCATQDVPFHTMGATQLPAAGCMQPL